MWEKMLKFVMSSEEEPEPLDEFGLGVAVGLAVSFRDQMSKLPSNKMAFLTNALALVYMLGGFRFGKTKMVTAFLVSTFCESIDYMVEDLCGAVVQLITDFVVLAAESAVGFKSAFFQPSPSAPRMILESYPPPGSGLADIDLCARRAPPAFNAMTTATATGEPECATCLQLYRYGSPESARWPWLWPGLGLGLDGTSRIACK
jgi:hypothetical protein